MSKTIREPEKIIDFDAILPDTGILFYEECPSEYHIEKPILLPLKSIIQTRFEQLQHQAVQNWKEKQKSAKKN